MHLWILLLLTMLSHHLLFYKRISRPDRYTLVEIAILACYKMQLKSKGAKSPLQKLRDDPPLDISLGQTQNDYGPSLGYWQTLNSDLENITPKS